MGKVKMVRLVLLCVVLVAVFVATEGKHDKPKGEGYGKLAGGWSKWKKASVAIKKMAKKFQPKVQDFLGMSFPIYGAISFKAQVVAGTNFFIKVKTCHGMITMKVFKPLPFKKQSPVLVEVNGRAVPAEEWLLQTDSCTFKFLVYKHKGQV